MEPADYGWTTGGDPSVLHNMRIAGGSSGVVHELHNIANGQIFARKLIHRASDRITPEDIQNEERAIKKLCCGPDLHPNIVEVLNLGSFLSYYYIDMERCDMNLEEYIYDERVVSTPTSNPHVSNAAPQSLIPIWNIMRQITSGVTFIHRNEEIHRDLKPKNILYSRKDSAWKIADFGFTSKGTSSRFYISNDARGTPCYRAPELLMGERRYNRKVDIWALGCVLHELVVRRRAFPTEWAICRHSDSGEEFNIILGETFNQETKTCISETIRSMLQIVPSERPSASTLFEKFQRFCQCDDVQADGQVHIHQDFLHNSLQTSLSLVSENDSQVGELMQHVEATTIATQLPESNTSLLEANSNNNWVKSIPWIAVAATIRRLLGR